jgi:hypothetical protein
MIMDENLIKERRRLVLDSIREIIYENGDWLDEEELAILNDCLHFISKNR